MQYNNKTFLLIGFSPTILKDEVHLGYPFFRKYDVIFDQNKRTLSFYDFKIGKKKKEIEPEEKKSNDDNNKTSGNNPILKIIVIVLLTIIFLLLILLLAFYIFRNIKRKEKSQLLEEFNEIN